MKVFPWPVLQLVSEQHFFDLANAAAGETLVPRLSPYTRYVDFLLHAFAFEDTGFMAYNSAVGALQDKSASIASVSTFRFSLYTRWVQRLSFQKRLTSFLIP